MSTSVAWRLAFGLFAFAMVSMAEPKCGDEDELYTVYFYGASDANMLKEQRCETSTDKTVEAAECRCYNMKYQDVVTKLGDGSGPVAVTARKLTNVSGGVTCRSALEKCEKACQTHSKTPDSGCPNLENAGVVIP